ncbi:MAG: hypothetical protein WDO56_24510 [Gammaproteobacteria bacterium]
MTPQAREVVRLQSKVNNKKLYGDALKKMGLGADQSDALLDLLSDQQVRQNESDRLLRRDRAALEQARAELQGRSDNEIAALIGPDKAAQFGSYQKTLPERMQVNNMADQLDALNLPIHDDQKEQLVNIMVEEKQNLPPQPEAASFRNPEVLEARIEWQQSYNRAVLDRASSLLTPGQYNQVRSIQDMQINMQQQMLQRQQRAQARAASRSN